MRLLAVLSLLLLCSCARSTIEISEVKRVEIGSIDLELVGPEDLRARYRESIGPGSFFLLRIVSSVDLQRVVDAKGYGLVIADIGDCSAERLAYYVTPVYHTAENSGSSKSEYLAFLPTDLAEVVKEWNGSTPYPIPGSTVDPNNSCLSLTAGKMALGSLRTNRVPFEWPNSWLVDFDRRWPQ